MTEEIKGTSARMPDRDVPLAAEFEPVGREAWLKLVDKVLKGAQFRERLVSYTPGGIAVEPLYTRADAPSEALTALPGHPPFARGTKYAPASPGWDIRQRHDEPNPNAANAAICEDLAGGASSLLLVLEAPGQAGLSHELDTLAEALQGVPLEACPVAVQAGANAFEAARNLTELWRLRGLAEDRRGGAFNADPLGTLAKTGTLPMSISDALGFTADLARACRSMAGVTALLADGRPYHEAGGSELHELAALLASLAAYLRCLENAGLEPETALPKIAIALAADSDLFLTIAKLRAARKLVWRVAQACGAGAAAAQVPLYVSSSERMMTRRDPHLNMVRATAACAGAAFGGADIITVLPFTWALGKPSSFARRIARNTQLVLREESAAARVLDPAGGAWYVERLTDDLAKAAWALFQDIEARGGLLGALESGFLQGEIARAAEKREQLLATGALQITGVSAFPLLEEETVAVEPHWPAPPIVPGPIHVEALPVRRTAARFEELRAASDEHHLKTGSRPRLFLAALGDPSGYAARSNWTKNFLAAGGIEAVAPDGFGLPTEAARAFAASRLSLACICAAETAPLELLTATAVQLKQQGAKQVLITGRYEGHQSQLKAAGVDTFLSPGCDAVALLRQLQENLGVGK
jgi:methylmalonyl-CoA mutase